MLTRTIFGTTGADIIVTPDGHDPSLAYDNIVQGLGGNDTIAGGTGNDWIWGSASDPGTVQFTGGAGDDVLIAFTRTTPNQPISGASLDGGTGNDILILGSQDGSPSGTSELLGGDGNDQLWALYCEMQFSLGSNVVTYLSGGSGDDTLVGGGFLSGGTGNDLLIVGGAIQGQSGDPQHIRGSVSAISEGFGNDGNDTLYAASGVTNVSLNGDDPTYDPYTTLTPASGHPGSDTLVGNGQNDNLDGGEGPNGGDGRSDVLIGAPGQDNFTLTSSAAAPAVDLIWNFENGTDKVGDALSGDSGRSKRDLHAELCLHPARRQRVQPERHYAHRERRDATWVFRGAKPDARAADVERLAGVTHRNIAERLQQWAINMCQGEHCGRFPVRLPAFRYRLAGEDSYAWSGLPARSHRFSANFGQTHL